jgi:dynein heavy chain
MEVVCTLLAEKTDWESAKKVLMDLGFIERLKTFDKNTIPDKITQKLKSYIMRADFEPV